MFRETKKHNEQTPEALDALIEGLFEPIKDDDKNSDEFYCTGQKEVTEGNKYLDVGKSPINFGVKIYSKKISFYFPSGEMIEMSLVNQGKYLETKNSVSATNNKFFLNIFVSKTVDEEGTDSNQSGVYQTFSFDKKKQIASLGIQSWNHLTKGDEYDTENFSYEVDGKCEIHEVIISKSVSSSEALKEQQSEPETVVKTEPKTSFPNQPIDVQFTAVPKRQDDIAVIIGNANYEKMGKDIPNVSPAYADAEGIKRYFMQAKGVRKAILSSKRCHRFTTCKCVW